MKTTPISSMTMFLLLCLGLAAMGSQAALAATIYVDADASGANTGTSWGNAYTNLQSALSAASSGDEIWVAAGTYKPSVEHGGTGERYKSFQMKNGVGIYGGFAGWEIGRNQRNWGSHVTILSGDIGTQGNDADNCYHVFYHPSGTNLNSSAVLDGFTITAGNTSDSGGGMYNNGSSPTLTNCTFFDNSAYSGGGIYNTSSDPTLTNCTFSGNSVSNAGGGMYNNDSSPILTNCTFFDNSANYSVGGGMSNYNSSPTLTNCTLSGNSANYGGGMYNGHSSPTLTNCTFSGNSASNAGGGIDNWRSSPTLTNCILWGDTALTDNEIYNYESLPTVTYCDIQGGYSGTGNKNENPLLADPAHGNFHLLAGSPCIDAGYNYAPYIPLKDFEDDERKMDGNNDGIATVDMGVDEVPYIRYVDAGASGANTGTSWADAYTDLQSALSAAASGQEIWVAAGVYTPSVMHGGTGVRNKSFQLKNRVEIYGGFAGNEMSRNQRDWVNNVTILSGDIGTQGYDDDNCYHVFYHPNGTNLNSTAVLDGFTITGGNANGYSPNDSGGGMYNDYDSGPTLSNCTFADNSATTYGGGMYNYTYTLPDPLLINCTFSGNSASYGGGLYNNHCSPTLTHCTFSDNSAYRGGGMRNFHSSPHLTNCIFASNVATSYGGGMYNTSSDPILTNCTFSGNSADYGGGMYNYDSSEPTLINSILWGDTAWTENEIYNDSSSSPLVSYCDIQGVYYPGTGNIVANPLFVDPAHGDLHLQAASPGIDAGNNSALFLSANDFEGDNRIIDGNQDGIAIVDMGADEYRPPMYVDAGASGANTGKSWEDAYTDLQSALSTATSGEEIWVAAGTYKPSVEYGGTGNRYQSFQLQNGVEIYGGFAGGETNRDQRDWVTNVTILSGDIGAAGVTSDNCYHVFYHPSGTNLNSTAILDGFTITGGNADGSYPHYFGGGMFNDESSPTLSNCTFSDNSASSGGGIYNTTTSYVATSAPTPILTNCTFVGNSATYGGGMFNNYYSLPTLTNCTFSGNVATNRGGGMYNANSSPILTNCIFWGDSAPTGNEMYNTSSSSPTVTYCDVQGGYSGTGNLNANPLFVNATNGNFHLQAGSPCIDAGNNAAPHLPATDIDGDDRILDGDGNGTVTVDMGVDEAKLTKSYLLWTK